MKTKSNLQIILLAAIAVIVVFTALFLAFDYWGMRRAGKLSMKLEQVSVGMPLENVLTILGKPSRSFTKEDEIKAWGPIKEEDIIKKCNMHFFPYFASPSCRYVIVYENKVTKRVEIITWIYM